MVFAVFATIFSPFTGFLIAGFKRGLRIEVNIDNFFIIFL